VMHLGMLSIMLGEGQGEAHRQILVHPQKV